MRRLAITYSNGSYDVIVGPGASRDEETVSMLRSRPALIVTDDNVAGHAAELQKLLPTAHTLILRPGENAKTLATVSGIWSHLAELRLGRDAVLVALGGGVIGDMTGFAAACWMRGIDFVQIPTTLLAQVDASVGGKTAVDMPAGKNLVGAFYQPLAVLADTELLQTLPAREYSAGFAEIIKAALLADAKFFGWIEANASALSLRDSSLLEDAIFRSCEIKAKYVTTDERESGVRALLNLGHTFAHALEAVTGYEQLLHGEAVAIGLVQALALSEQHCGLDRSLRPRLVEVLEAFALPVTMPPQIQPDAVLDAMRLDKKHLAGHWRLVVLRALGDAVIVELPDPAAVRAALLA